LWIVKPKEEFVAWYKEAFYQSWAKFALNFGEARALFDDADQWKAVIERFASDDSPYLGLLQTMEEQLLGVEKDRWPSLELDAEKDLYTLRWLDQIRDFGIIRKAVASEKLTENKAATEQLSRQVSNKVRIAAKIVKGSMGESKLAKGKQALKRYQEALRSFNGITASGSHAYEIVKAGFEDNPAQAKSPVYSAQKAVDNIRSAMAPKEGWTAEAEQNPFWHLITEPVNALWQFSVQQAGCHLQEMWDQEVIVKTEGVYNQHQLVSLLFGDKGYADKFINNHAGPFVVRSSRRGYHTKEVRGCAIPFKKSYFSFIRQGKRWGTVSSGAGKTHVVRVGALPTDVNIEARVKPHMTRLVLDGADGGTVLENRQYPIEKNFSWSPSTSGDVTLQIMLGDITLTRKYTGYNAFGRFLREFKNGKRVFTVHDFKNYRHEFNRLGVNQIIVYYQLQARQVAPIVRMLNTTPGRPPAVIISCVR
jgi:type VI secretion system protein ImpL